jgi:hypothetical protein
MNNPRPARSASLSLQQTTVGPGDPAELRVRWIKNPSHWPALPVRSPQPAGSATSEGAGA